VQRNMPPMPNDARGWLSPGATAISRQVIPVEALSIELPLRPPGQSAYRIKLGYIGATRARPVRARGESVGHPDVRPDPDNENPPPCLGNSEILRVQNAPNDTVSRHAKAGDLVHQECAVHAVGHPVDVFDYKCLRTNLAKRSVEMPVEIVHWLRVIAPPPLAVTLAWVTADEEIGTREFAKGRNVPLFNFGA
jgi:hypothetical protein